MEMEYTSFWRRAAAALIDGLILCAIWGLTARIFFPFALIVQMLYRPVFEASKVRATPGKYLAEISVVRTNGDRLTLKDAYIRYFSSWLSTAFLFFGYAMALFTKKRQTLHDLFADTVVVDRVYESNGLFNEWWTSVNELFYEIKKFFSKNKESQN